MTVAQNDNLAGIGVTVNLNAHIIVNLSASDEIIGKAREWLRQEEEAAARLQAELDKAVQEQRYEDAAVLRDQIKELKPEE